MKTREKIVYSLLTILVIGGLISCNKKSQDKQITSFVFNDLNPPVSGTINEGAKKIDVVVPELTDVTNLTPTIVISDKATINPSSGTPQDFTDPVNYKVTAEDESSVGYSVIVSSGASDNIEINWSMLAEPPTARGWMSVVTLNNKIYVIGGIIEGDPVPVSSMEVYDPATDTWDTTRSNMNYTRYAHSANVVDGKIYVMGGIIGAFGPAINNAEVYDPTTDIWTEIAAMPEIRAAHGASVIDGRIYLIAGESEEPAPGGTFLSSVDVYDPSTDLWLTAAPLPTPTGYLWASALNEKIYALGGVVASGGEGVASVYEYDPQANTWTQKNDIKTPRWSLTTVVLNDMVFCLGGSFGGISSGLTRVEAYSAANDKCYTASGMLTKSYGQGASIYQNKIYVIGGCKSPPPYYEYYNKTLQVGVLVDK